MTRGRRIGIGVFAVVVLLGGAAMWFLQELGCAVGEYGDCEGETAFDHLVPLIVAALIALPLLGFAVLGRRD